ncbi:MAG: hypothetical protein ACRDRP_16020 [Pseudonocardiaceae bacterium]
MTAPCESGDAELVAGLRAGDQRCLAGIYDRYADRLYDFCAGLSEGDCAMLRLHLHGLEGAELAAALGISASTAHVRLSRLRDQVERSLGALLVARLGRRDCDELAAVLGEWDGRFTPLLRKRVTRHVDNCSRCAERQRAVASPRALLSGVALLPAPLDLRERVLGDVRLVAHGSSEQGSVDGGPDAGAAVAPGVGLPLRWPGSAGHGWPAALRRRWWSLPSSGVSRRSGVRGPSRSPRCRPSRSRRYPTPLLGSPSPTPDATIDPTPTPVTTAVRRAGGIPARAGAARLCLSPAQAKVRVTLAADAPATVLSWNGAGGSGSMQGSGTTWSGSLGPFPEGQVQWSVTASNAADSTTGPTETIAVSCRF